MRPRYLRDLHIEYRPNAARLITHDQPIRNAADAAAIFIPLLSSQPQEVFSALYLDTKHRMIAYREIHRGTLSEVAVHARDVITPGLLINAAGCIIAHNHPGGDPNPSPDDCALTRRLIDAAALLDFEIYDHLIIGENQYVSFQQTGRM